MRDQSVGVVGTGRIGEVVAQIMRGFGCRLLGFDPFPSSLCKSLGMEYVFSPELFAGAISSPLHCALTPEIA
jgi:D-lactate dehydrogenase